MANTSSAQFTIIDYNDGISLITGIGSNLPLTQQFDDATGTLTPSWDSSSGGTALQLSPRAVKTTAAGSTNVFTLDSTSNIQWYRRYNGENNWTTLTNTGDETWNNTTGSTKGVLQVSRNKLLGHDQVDYRVTASYYDNNLQLSFPLDISITLSRVKNGTSYILATIESPSGTQFINHSPATLLFIPQIIRGAVVDRSNDTYVWSKSTDGINWTTITSTQNVYTIVDSGEHKGELTLYPDGVTGGFTMFRVAITEGDSSQEGWGQTFTSDAVSVHDFDDPWVSEIESTGGNFFKNSVGSTYLICHVYHGAQGEIDPTGSLYYYTWTKTNSDGSPDATFNAHPENYWAAHGSVLATRGKCIQITDAQVDVKATFFCSVTETNPNSGS